MNSFSIFTQHIPIELENDTVIVTEPMEPVMESGDAQSHVIEQQEQPPFRPSPIEEQMPIKRFKFSPLTQGKSVRKSLDEDRGDKPPKKIEVKPSTAFKNEELSDDDFDFDDIEDEDVKKLEPVAKAAPVKKEVSSFDNDERYKPTNVQLAKPSAAFENAESSNDDSEDSDEDEKNKKKPSSGRKKPELKVVFFDLETTGIDQRTRHDKIQICTISAYHEGAMFEGYLKPTNKFQPGATRFNGMSMFRGNLMKNGKKVESAETMASGLRRFIAWLTDVCEPEKNDKIVLIAHSCHNFDAVILLKNLREVGLEFPSNVVFVDTMTIMRKIPIGAKWPSFDSSLNFFFGRRERDHNAESNTHNLVQLASAAAKYLGYKDFCSYLKTNSSGIKRASQICL